MTPGTILFDSRFRFHDGIIGKKLFVILTDGTAGQYVGVKTTSNGSRFRLDFGCQVHHRFPCYFLPKGSCCLDGNSWLCLDEFYEFEQASLVQRVMERRIDRIGVLPEKVTIELIGCALASEDISGAQGSLLMDCWRRLKESRP